MVAMTVTVTATANETRILVQDQSGVRMIGRLDSLPSAAHSRALPTLLEAFALWCGQTLPVVIYVDESFDWSRSNLADRLGFGQETLFYRAEVVPLEAHRPDRAERLSGFGSFARERRARRGKQ
jgi:hypothetical protein